ncbi:MAG: PIN domain-containing protein [Deltaproteobacteria bacterium]|jgi:predicted nucleic acid-binding protein|nr:PIN domain-containing protein [Deltaproteobacteria bacterium]
MPDRLIDTNILVYAYDISESTKHDIAKDILKQIWQDGEGVVCVQNLMEFFVVITKKVTYPIPVADAKIIIDDMTKSDSWRVIDRDINTFLKAIDIVSQHAVHLWDATIIACMKESGVTHIVTENTSDFEGIPDIHVILPF